MTSEEVSDAQAQAALIASASVEVVQGNQFVFFVAFDGTNNDVANVELSGNPQSTNVAMLATQVAGAATGNVAVSYFSGVGTGGSPVTNSTWMSASVTQQIIDKAEQAYSAFADAAIAWLDDHPGGSVTTMVTAFSRGCASAAVFSQLLYERGLVNAATHEVLVAPGEIGVSAGVLFDPVYTGIEGNLTFAPNASNIVDICASEEFRYAFRAADYSAHEGITTIEFAGNHCDIGGGYDNGLGALTLEAATDFLAGTGLAVDDVAVERQFDELEDVVVHNEGVAIDPSGNPHVIWSEYDPFEGRLTSNTPTVAVVEPDGDGGTLTTFTDASGRNVIYSQTSIGELLVDAMTLRDGTSDDLISVTTVYKFPDGTKAISKEWHNPDGTWGEYHDYGNGTTDTYIYEPGGLFISTAWDHGEGGHGEITYHSVDGDYFNNQYYHKEWTGADGTSFEIEDRNLDGSESGSFQFADGTYGSYWFDGNETYHSEWYDEGGIYFSLKDEFEDGAWNTSYVFEDGTHGSDNFDANGVGHHERYVGDGFIYSIRDKMSDGSEEIHERYNPFPNDNPTFSEQLDLTIEANGSFEEILYRSDGYHHHVIANALTHVGVTYVWEADGTFSESTWGFYA